MKAQFLVFILALVGIGYPIDLVAGDGPKPKPIKVMSFNVRYGAAKDGTNSWTHRRDLVAQTIRVSDPDLLGLQESLDFQVTFLREQLPGYGFHGVGREDGSSKGEYVPVMFKEDRFESLDAGFFWLSETPDVPGSVSWDSSLTRMLSWVLLRDRIDDRELVFANVHFDHRGKQARMESAKLIRERAVDLEGMYPVILCGDFNTTEEGAPYRELTRVEPEGDWRLIDSYRVIHPQRLPNEATFNGWKAVRRGSRIDWILHTPEFVPLNALINYTTDTGRSPSDHYPVEAVLRLKE